MIVKPVIIKGCADKPIPASAYTLLIEKIQPVARTIMFGEACSTVPLYKKKKIIDLSFIINEENYYLFSLFFNSIQFFFTRKRKILFLQNGR